MNTIIKDEQKKMPDKPLTKENIISDLGETVIHKINQSQGSNLILIILFAALCWFWLSAQFDSVKSEIKSIEQEVVNIKTATALLSIASDVRWDLNMQKEFAKQLGNQNENLNIPDVVKIKEEYGEYYDRVFEALKTRN